MIFISYLFILSIWLQIYDFYYELQTKPIIFYTFSRISPLKYDLNSDESCIIENTHKKIASTLKSMNSLLYLKDYRFKRTNVHSRSPDDGANLHV